MNEFVKSILCILYFVRSNIRIFNGIACNLFSGENTNEFLTWHAKSTFPHHTKVGFTLRISERKSNDHSNSRRHVFS